MEPTYITVIADGLASDWGWEKDSEDYEIARQTARSVERILNNAGYNIVPDPAYHD